MYLIARIFFSFILFENTTYANECAELFGSDELDLIEAQLRKDAVATLALRRAIEMADARLPRKYRKALPPLSAEEKNLSKDEIEEARVAGEAELRAHLKLVGFKYQAKNSKEYVRALLIIKSRLVNLYLQSGYRSLAKYKEYLARGAKIMEETKQKLNSSIENLDQKRRLLELNKRIVARLSSTGPETDPIDEIVTQLLIVRAKYPEISVIPEVTAFGQLLVSHQYLYELSYAATAYLAFTARNWLREIRGKYQIHLDDLRLAGVITEFSEAEGRSDVDNFMEDYRAKRNLGRYWRHWHPFSYSNAMSDLACQLANEIKEVMPATVEFANTNFEDGSVK